MKIICFMAGLCIVMLSPGVTQADRFLYPQAELMDPAFVLEHWGSGSLISRSVLPNSAVRFQIALGPDTLVLLGNGWPIASAAGLAWDGGYYPGSPSAPHASAHNNISIAAWDGIQMRIKYASGPGDIQMRLFMHTGMTGGSGYPSWTGSNETWWHGTMETLSVGETALLDLDFDNAMVLNAFDNTYHHSGYGQAWTDETWHVINERDRREVTHLGIQIYAPTDGQIVIDTNAPVPEPSSLLLSVTVAVLFGLSLIRFNRSPIP